MTHSDPDSTALPDRLAQLARRFGIADVYVFGSRAMEIAARVRGTLHDGGTHPDSDVDIGVRPRLRALRTVDERVALTQELESLLGVERVDLVVLPETGAFLALAAVSGELLF